MAKAMLVLPLLAAACADPTAVQKFAQSAPPQAQFQALLLDYPGVLAQQAQAAQLARVDVPLGQGKAELPPEVASFCAHIPTLDRLHGAMVAYMNALDAAATAGTPLKSQSATPGATGASGAGSAAAPPAQTAGGSGQGGSGQGGSGQGSCPPPVMPVVAAAAPAPSSAPAAAPAAAGSGGPAATGNPMTTALEGFAAAFPELKITKGQADAASSLVVLIQDVATTVMRERAVEDALKQGHDAFPAAIAVERAIIQYLSERAQRYAVDLSTDLTGISSSVGAPDARSQRAGQSAATRMLLAFAGGQIMTPQQAQNVRAAAETYLTALDNLEKAFTKLSNTAGAGQDVLTPATWTVIQPLLTDVANAYAALSKL